MTPRAASSAAPPSAGDATSGHADAQSLDDAAWRARLAQRIVTLGLEAPARLALESATPVAGLAGHALVFLHPLAAALFGAGDVERLARLFARREDAADLAARIAALTPERR